MKKIALILSLALSFVATGCYTTQGVVSNSMYENSRNQVASNMEANGYILSGENHEEKNEMVVTGQSYSKYTGYGTKMDNDFYSYDTYKYSNQEGDNAEYTVKYKGLVDDNGGYALSSVQVLGCKTSKAADYEKLCSGNSSPSNVIGNMSKDSSKTELDVANTTIAVTGITTVLSLLLCLMLL